MRRSQQDFSAPSKQTQSSNAKDELSSTASINASSTTLIPSSELLASKPRDSTLKREQNSCYEHDNGLRAPVRTSLADGTAILRQRQARLVCLRCHTVAVFMRIGGLNETGRDGCSKIETVIVRDFSGLSMRAEVGGGGRATVLRPRMINGVC